MENKIQMIKNVENYVTQNNLVLFYFFGLTTSVPNASLAIRLIMLDWVCGITALSTCLWVFT